MMHGAVAETGCEGQVDVFVRSMLGFETPFRVTGMTDVIAGLLALV
jgi:hypothetical protein